MNRLRALGIGLLWSLWFSFCFSSFLWLTFPWSRVRDHLIVRASDAGISLQMRSLGAALFGVRAKELALGKAHAGDDAAPWIVFESLRVSSSPGALLGAALEARKLGAKSPSERPSLLKLLGGLGLSGDLYGGDLDVEVEDREDGAHISFSGDGIDVSERVWKAESWSVNPTGNVDLSGDLQWSTKDTKNTEGTVDLVAKDLALAGLRVMGMDVPTATFKKAEAHLKVQKGRGEFQETVFESEVFTAYVEGTISLATDWKRCRLALKLRFDLGSGMEVVEGLLKATGGGNHQDEDGFWHYQVIGTLDKPRWRPSPSNARRAANAAKGGARPVGRPAPLDRPGIEGADEPAPRGPVNVDDGSYIPEDMGNEAAERVAEKERLKENRQKRREERRKRREELERLKEERAAERAGGGIVGGKVEEPLHVPEEDWERTNEPEVLEEVPVDEGEEE